MIRIKTTVLVDRNCGLCNTWEKRLSTKVNRTVAFDAIERLDQYIHDEKSRAVLLTSDSMIVIQEGDVFIRSAAIRALLAECAGPYKYLGWLLSVVPRPIGDVFYRIISRNRHRLGRCDVNQ